MRHVEGNGGNRDGSVHDFQNHKASTMVTLLQGNPGLDFSLVYDTEEGRKNLDTREMREILGEDVPLDSPSVLMWVAELIREPFDSEDTAE